MGQGYPTKDEVEEFRNSANEVDCINNPATAAMIMKQRCLNLCDAYLALREEVEKERKERIKWQRIRKPTHGPCCTCQRCGQSHDDCRCDLDEVCDELDQLKAQNQALRARLGNNILEA